MDDFKFMDSWPEWVRWLLVLPASVLAVAFYTLAETVVYVALARAGKSDLLVPLIIGASFFGSALFVWCGVATSPRFKLTVASILAAVPIWLAYRDYATRATGLHLVGANEVISYILNTGMARVGGVVIAWGLALWGYRRRRQAGLPSR